MFIDSADETFTNKGFIFLNLFPSNISCSHLAHRLLWNWNCSHYDHNIVHKADNISHAPAFKGWRPQAMRCPNSEALFSYMAVLMTQGCELISELQLSLTPMQNGSGACWEAWGRKSRMAIHELHGSNPKPGERRAAETLTGKAQSLHGGRDCLGFLF